MIRKAWTLIVSGAALALAATSFNAVAQGSNEGYWASTPGGAIWKNPFGMCWRSGYWTPALANSECDPDLVNGPPRTRRLELHLELPTADGLDHFSG